MSKTHVFDGYTYHLTSNFHARELVCLEDILATERHWFNYITGEDAWEPRLFSYRGSWYDYGEFEVAPPDIRALGFHGIQVQSAFSAIVIRYDYDGDDVIVGHVHW